MAEDVLSPPKLSPEDIRTLRAENPKSRARDFAEAHGLSEAQLVAAFIGQGATPIPPHPDQVMELAMKLGRVMALTRNPSCVSEKTGIYANYRSGPHACMVLNDAIDLRLFPAHWCHAFMVEKETDAGVSRSLQVFDAAGDAVHKIHLQDDSSLAAWETAKAELALDTVDAALPVALRKAAEAPKGDSAKAELLRKEWARMTDTHQFMRLTSKLKMNRLGAYRIAGTPHACPLNINSVDDMLHQTQTEHLDVMIFVGNRGCIQIHTGPVNTLRTMGPWQNVLDPEFNLHLRLDHIAEVWAVNKPTQRGPARSIEAFDKDGSLILQVFGTGNAESESRKKWSALVDTLTAHATEVA